MGEKYDLHNGSVVRIIRKAGIERNQHVPLTEEIIKEIIVLFEHNAEIKDIALQFDIDPTTVIRNLKKKGFELDAKGNRKYQLNEDLFSEINNEESAYFLGLIYARGSISLERDTINISLKKEYSPILQKLSSIIYGLDKVQIQLKGFGKDKLLWKEYSVLIFYSKKMRESLIKLGCGPRKSENLIFPKNLMNTKCLRHFVRGFLDGKAFIGFNNDRPIIDITSTKEFLTGLKDWTFDNLGIMFNNFQNNKDYSEETRGMRMSSIYEIKIFLEFIYNDCSLYSESKRETVNQIITLCNNKKKNPIDLIKNLKIERN